MNAEASTHDVTASGFEFAGIGLTTDLDKRRAAASTGDVVSFDIDFDNVDLLEESSQVKLCDCRTQFCHFEG
jgi:hypothetical protein